MYIIDITHCFNAHRLGLVNLKLVLSSSSFCTGQTVHVYTSVQGDNANCVVMQGTAHLGWSDWVSYGEYLTVS